VQAGYARQMDERAVSLTHKCCSVTGEVLHFRYSSANPAISGSSST